MADKLTPWYPGNIKPERVGVYQRDYSDGGRRVVIVYSRWDGKYFHVCGENAIDASRKNCESSSQSSPWRGLAKDPK